YLAIEKCASLLPNAPGGRAPAIAAPPFTLGRRAASATPATACAPRARASATARLGLSCSASAISASSCGSPSPVHQSACGHAASDGTWARLRPAWSEDGSIGVPSGCRPPLLAQPASARVSPTAPASRCRPLRFQSPSRWGPRPVLPDPCLDPFVLSVGP